MAIVKYKNPHSGVVYAYESTPRWNPVTKRNEPVRRYLGRVSETGEIIPTEGKRGRKTETASSPEQPTYAQYETVVRSLQQTETMLSEQRRRVVELESENARLKQLLASIAKQVIPFAN